MRILLPLLIILSLAGGAYYARQIKPGDDRACITSDPQEVERSYSLALKALKDGKREETLLFLRKRAEKGPHKGGALYLLGNLAYEEGAYTSAVDNYRMALKADRTLGDAGGPFNAKKTILMNMEALKRGPWRGRNTKELSGVNGLLRALNGGCE
ncbi:MAG: hypothetical protein C0608_07255 [Deltaproteobacteria bacterium]|nr:MAG: hypothetical protein C0608_07255 [Deltaproteobacteria bacterium]